MIDHLSFSSLRLYLDNPYAWHRRYIQGIRDDKTGPAALEGSALHKYIELTLKGFEKADALSAAEQLIHKATDVEWGKTGSVEKSLKRLGNLVSSFSTVTLPGVVLDTEKQFNSLIKGIKVPLMGYVDATFTDNDGNIIVCDWKSVSVFHDELPPSFIIQGVIYFWLTELEYKKKVTRCDFVEIRSVGEEQRTKVLTLLNDGTYDRAVKSLIKESLKQMSGKKKPLPNISADYTGDESWKEYIKSLN